MDNSMKANAENSAHSRMISRHHHFLKEIGDLLAQFGWNIWKFRVHRTDEIDEFPITALYTFTDFHNVMRRVLFLDDRVQHLYQAH